MKNKCSSEIPNMPTGCAPDNRRSEKMRNVSIFKPGISGKWKARPGMFGNKGNERGERNTPTPVERNIIFVAQMGDTKTV